VFPSGRRIISACIAAVVVAGPALGDRIELTGGRQIDGSITRVGDHFQIVPITGKAFTATPAEILRVTLVSNVSPDAMATAEWGRTQLLFKRATRLDDVIALHQKFIAAYPTATVRPDVEASLAVYEKYQDEHRINFRGQWITTEERQSILRKSSSLAEQALTSYRAGNLNDAVANALAALQVDDQNALAYTVQAMTDIRLNRAAEAKTEFLTVTKVDPTNLLAWNNLAIIAFRDRRDPEGLRYFNQAIQIGPDHRLLLDNIAEALNMYEGPKDNANYINLSRAFTQADVRMQANLAKQGLFRFGGTWVTGPQRDSIAKTTTDVIARANDLESQYQSALAALDKQERALVATRQQYDSAVSYLLYLNNLLYAEAGRGISDPYVATSRDSQGTTINQLANQIQVLTGQVAQTRGAIDSMKTEADRIRPQLDVAKASIYSGILRIMEPGDTENPPAPLPVNAPGPAAIPLVIPKGTPGPGVAMH
jgi:tetratricopeptide (TPR) repeat protein